MLYRLSYPGHGEETAPIPHKRQQWTRRPSHRAHVLPAAYLHQKMWKDNKQKYLLSAIKKHFLLVLTLVQMLEHLTSNVEYFFIPNSVQSHSFH